jgi:ribosomal protein S12 methylthiotransferase accessory factor
MAAATRAAIFEMCQSELAYGVIDAKRDEAGEAGLNQADLRHLQRRALINTRTCELLQPEGPFDLALDGEERSFEEDLRSVVNRLQEIGIETLAVDLTRPFFGIPVVRVVTPGLQLEPSEIDTERLIRAIAFTGGGRVHTGGVALL